VAKGRPVSFSEEQIRSMVEAYASGRSSYCVGREFKCSPMTVLKYVRLSGCEVREVGKYTRPKS
jgi:hypothetical protein